MIVTARARLDWIDTLPEPERTFAVFGAPESDWPRLKALVSDTLDVIHDRTERVWHPNPRMMEYGQPVGYWSTEKRP